MDTDAYSPLSKIDTWLKQLVSCDISDHKAPRQEAYRNQGHKDQVQYRSHISKLPDKILTTSAKVYDAPGHSRDLCIEDRRVEVERWISGNKTGASPTRQGPSSYPSSEYASSQGDRKRSGRRQSAEHRSLRTKAARKRKKPSSEVGFGSSLEQHIKRSPKFEKQARRKTRQDRYDTRPSKPPRNATEPTIANGERQRSKRPAQPKPSRDVVAKFTSDAILSKRVSTHPGPGLFGKRKPPKRPIVDLEFHDMNFMKASAEEASTKNPSRTRGYDRTREYRLNEEVSAFFTKTPDLLAEQNQKLHRTPSTEYRTISDRASAQTSDSYPSQLHREIASGPKLRTVTNYPSKSSRGISSPLRQQLPQRLEQLACPNRANTSSPWTGTSLNKITHPIIETGVLESPGPSRMRNRRYPSSSQELARDNILQQSASNGDFLAARPGSDIQNSQVQSYPGGEFGESEPKPLRQLPSTRNDAHILEKAVISSPECGLSVDEKAHTTTSLSSLKSLPTSIPARPKPPISKLVQRLQKAVDNDVQPYSPGTLSRQVATGSLADHGLYSQNLQPLVSDFHVTRIAPAPMFTPQPNFSDLQTSFSQRHLVDSGFRQNTTRTSPSPAQTLFHNGEVFHRFQKSCSPLASQDGLRRVQYSQQPTDMAHYIATIESEVSVAESDLELRETYDERWDQDDEAYLGTLGMFAGRTND